MRFRYLTMGDIPECVRLYNEVADERRPTELNYPRHTEHTAEEFTVGLARQLVATPPNWIAIVGVVQSTIRDAPDGSKQVYGGRVKGLLTITLSERIVGDPKLAALIELFIVDSKFRGRDVARKLLHLGAVECAQRGAQVLEAVWSPGSIGEEFATKIGFRPYRTLGAYVLDDGMPRTDLPLPKAAVEAEPEPAKPSRKRRVSDEAAA